MGNFLALGKPSEVLGDRPIHYGKLAIGTVCSIRLNGILLSQGIPVTSRFGGLLEIKDMKPTRFVEIIEYRGSSLDQLEIFITGGMTSVGKAAATGNGLIGAGFREVPANALRQMRKILRSMNRLGLGGILAEGLPNQPLLGIPVTEGRAGIIVAGGLNPVAAAFEHGIPTDIAAMASLFDYSRLQDHHHTQIDE